MADDSLIACEIGGCRIDAFIGGGAAASVYRGTQLSLGRPVAIKIMRRGVEKLCSIDRFFREARAVARITHPNIVQVYDAGKDGDTAYIIMELVTGQSLDTFLSDAGMALGRALRIMADAARGLAEAHRYGLIHRDIKPDNILIASTGEAKVADFGLVKDYTDKTLTVSGIILGTPTYISPEACWGDTLDGRADLYSLGATFYHLICGAPPFHSRVVTDLLLKHAYTPAPSMLTHKPDLSPEIDAVFLKLLEKDPKNRIQSAEDLLGQLERVCKAAVTPTTEPLPPTDEQE
ncbi:serine/threonine-protein kinase, partial [Planctomycetota bacterium]